ncbi:MAG: ABC transporter permease [Chloroflexota bacterium]
MSKRALAIDLIVLLAVWFVAAEALDLRMLPSPLQVLEVFWSELTEGKLGMHLLISTRRILISTALGVALAAPLAIVAAQLQLLDRFLTPLMYFLYPVPKVVFLPVILVFLGLTDTSRVFLITLIIFFQVYVIVRDAAGQVRPETLDSVYSLGASRWHMLRYVYIPVTIPAIMTALKISAGTAIAVLFIAESFATTTGLGYYIMIESWGRVAYANMYAGILAISLLGSILFLVTSFLERRLGRWRER